MTCLRKAQKYTSKAIDSRKLPLNQKDNKNEKRKITIACPVDHYINKWENLKFTHQPLIKILLTKSNNRDGIRPISIDVN